MAEPYVMSTINASTLPQAIPSKRLALLPMTVEFLKASLAGDVARATKSLGVAPPAEWLRAQEFMHFRLAQLQADPALQPWLLRALILRSTGSMIGHIIFHTAPNPAYLQPIAPGGIELGYSIYPAYRRHGYATEAVGALMAWAVREHNIPRFVLFISPDNLPSLRIAQHFGFHKVGSQTDEVDGLKDILILEAKDILDVQSSE
jgi:RimJ/RimL family protein N-acetyltransferase